MARSNHVYSIDTSALIDLPLRYPRAVFEGVWRSLEQLVAVGRLRAPREVRRELAKKEGDAAHRWVRSNGNLIVGLSARQQGLLRTIMRQFPTWVDHQTMQPVADPAVIALAQSFSPAAVVITHEQLGGAGALKIPNVCRQYNIRYMTLAELFVAEGWRFVPPPPTAPTATARRGRGAAR